MTATFPGSADYAPATTQATFTIGQATPTVLVTDAGGVYHGSSFPASASVAGASGVPGFQPRRDHSRPDLLRRRGRRGHPAGRTSHGGGNLHRDGRLPRQCRLRTGDDAGHLHHRPGHPDGSGHRRRRGVSRLILPRLGLGGGGQRSPGDQPRRDHSRPDLLRRRGRRGHPAGRTSHGGGDLHRDGRLPRQCRLRTGDDAGHLHHRPGHPDGSGHRRRRGVSRLILPRLGLGGGSQRSPGCQPRREPLPS